jgi:hypothetical protein
MIKPAHNQPHDMTPFATGCKLVVIQRASEPWAVMQRNGAYA